MEKALEILNRKRLSSTSLTEIVEINLLIERDVAIKRANKILIELQESFHSCLVLKTLYKNRFKAVCNLIDSLDEIVEYKLENHY